MAMLVYGRVSSISFSFELWEFGPRNLSTFAFVGSAFAGGGGEGVIFSHLLEGSYL